MKVLLIEDEQFIARLYQRVFEENGHSVAIKGDGIEGLEAASSGDFDVVIIDLMIPTLTGGDVLEGARKKLREIGKEKTKLIIATNYEPDTNSRAHLESLADGFIIKANVTPHELLAKVEEIAAN